MAGFLSTLRILWLLLNKDFKVLRRRKIFMIIEIILVFLFLCCSLTLLRNYNKKKEEKFINKPLDLVEWHIDNNDVGIVWPLEFTIDERSAVLDEFNATCPHLNFIDSDQKGERVDLIIKTFRQYPNPFLDFEVFISTRWNVQLPMKSLYFNKFGTTVPLSNKDIESRTLTTVEHKALYTQECINRVFLSVIKPNDTQRLNITFGQLPSLTTNSVIFQFFGVLVMFIQITSTCMVMKEATVEKENGIHLYLRAIGLSRYVFYASHYIFAMIKMFALAAVFCIMAAIFDKHMTLLLAPLIFLYGNVICAVGLVGITLFKKSVHVIFFITFYPLASCILFFCLKQSLFNSTAMIILSFLNPTTSFFSILFHYNTAFVHNQKVHLYTGFDFYLPVLYPFIAMILHFLIFIVAAIYIELVLPLDELPKLHPLFFLGFKQKSQVFTNGEDESSDHSNPDRHQVSSASGELLLEVSNLVKRWSNGETAVNNISFKIHAGEVVSLLGHNGAGKTTTFSCLTKFIKPTSGDINLFKDNCIGYCPQFNPLFPKLTVIEHMEFYCKFFTGKCPDDTVLEATIQKIELGKFENTNAEKLSGGMKRRLSFGISLLSGSNVILLDEPTVGIDTHSRRNMINLVKSLTLNRAVLMTTHYMDEAEALSDHINIMCKGKIICSGSSEFLKSKFGVGFLLTVDLSLSPREEVETLNSNVLQVLQLVKNFCPTAEFYGPVTSPLTIMIPATYRSVFAQMLGELEAKKNELNIDSVNVSMNTLDQVFVNVTKEAIEAEIETKDDFEEKMENFIDQCKNVRTGPSLIWSQMKALFLRKFHFFWRDFFEIIIVIAAVAYTVFFSLEVYNTKVYGNAHSYKSGSANLNLSEYFEMAIGVVPPERGNLAPPGDLLKKMNYPNINRFETVPMSNFDDVHLGKRIFQKMFKLPVPGFYYLVDLYNVIILTNKGFKGGEYVGLQMLYDSVLPGCINATLSYEKLHYKGPKNLSESDYKIYEDLLFGIGFIYNLILLAPPFLYSTERENGIHKLYARTRLTQLVYWITAYISDIFISTLLHILITAVIFGSSVFHISCLAPFFIGIFIQFFAFFCQAYAITLLFKSTGSVAIVLITINVVLSTCITLALWKLKSPISFILYFLPLLPGVTLFTTMANFCEKCYQPVSFMDMFKISPKIFNKTSLWTCVAVCITFYTSLMLIVLVWPLFLSIFNWKNGTTDEYDTKNVASERERVNASNIDDFAVVGVGLKKRFRRCGKRPFTAVFNATFGINKGECFGLMGTNGAGKSTTFNMLTGSIRPTAGRAYVNGKKVTRFPTFGYCPQDDSFIPELTVYEFFVLFARLNGIKSVHTVTNIMLSCLKLKTRKNAMIKLCSGGEKRRVALGVALITNSDILMLDEPTSGVDPFTRRYVWETLLYLIQNGSTILLTSHSMEECEALCTRIAFLTKGRLIALGTSQYLKHTLGDEYCLVITLNQRNPGLAHNLNICITKTFNATGNIDLTEITHCWMFKKSDKSLAELYVLLDNCIAQCKQMSLSGSFELSSGDSSEEKNNDICESHISSVTLEDVFIRFAEKIIEMKSII